MAAWESDPCDQCIDLLARVDYLTEKERDTLEEHLAWCESCQREFRNYETIDSLIHSSPLLQPPPLRWDRVSTRLPYSSRLVALAGSRWPASRVVAAVAMAADDLWAERMLVMSWLVHHITALPVTLSRVGHVGHPTGARRATTTRAMTLGRLIPRVVVYVASAVGIAVAVLVLLGRGLAAVISWTWGHMVSFLALARGVVAGLHGHALRAADGRQHEPRPDVRHEPWPTPADARQWLETASSQALASAGLACLVQSPFGASAAPHVSSYTPLRPRPALATREGSREAVSQSRASQADPVADRIRTMLAGASRALRATTITLVRGGAVGSMDPTWGGAGDGPDGEWEISAERKAFLRAMLSRWNSTLDDGSGPFAGVPLTGADVRWLLIWVSSAADVARRRSLNLNAARLIGADLQRLDLRSCALQEADLRGARLAGADLRGVWLSGASLVGAHLEHADLGACHLDHADLTSAHLQCCALVSANLESANLGEAHLDGADLTRAQLEGANLSAATFDKESRLAEARLSGIWLDQVTFDDVNLAVVDWSGVGALGEELLARRGTDARGKPKNRTRRLREYRMAARATRHLASALRGQGLTEPADRFAYRAHVLQRAVARRERRWVSYSSSLALDLVSGYGYRPLRSVLTYLLAVTSFALVYFLLVPASSLPHAVWAALVLSVTSLHGRGFAFDHPILHPTVATLAAIEATIGLLIEVLFIVSFTQRFLNR